MKSTLPLAWLYRVGLSQVSYEWRLIFFSSAPRIRSHGFTPAVTVAVDNGISEKVPCCEPAGATRLRSFDPDGDLKIAQHGRCRAFEHSVVHQKLLSAGGHTSMNIPACAACRKKIFSLILFCVTLSRLLVK